MLIIHPQTLLFNMEYMESHRSDCSLLILLFHLLSCCTFAGDILYQHYNVFTRGSMTWGGRLKYLTHINENLQCLYFLVAFIGDVYLMVKSSSKTKNLRIIKLQDYMFTVVAFPVGMVTSVAFWSIYAIDRNLIYPEILDTIIPKVCNQIMHTAPVVYVMLEVFLVHHKFPRIRTSLLGTLIIALLYYAWVICQKQVTSEWPYPFLDHFTVAHHVMFFTTCYVCDSIFCVLGKYCGRMREKFCDPDELKRKSI